MKKTTAFFLSVGVLAMIVGGIGSLTYFRQAQRSMTETKKETYHIKKKESTEEIYLDLSGNADFYILTEDTDQVVLKTRSSLPLKINSTLKVEENGNRLNISANSKKNKVDWMDTSLSLNIFDRGSVVNLIIPQDTKRLIIGGKATSSIHLSNIVTKDIAIKADNADISVAGIKTDKLAIETTNGDINSAFDIQSDEASFKTKSGDMHISKLSAAKFSAASFNGDIDLDTVKGKAKIESNNGDIQANNVKGEAEIKGTKGSFTLSGSDIPKQLTVVLQTGDIQINTEEILYDVVIKAKTALGDSEIFGKERTTFKQGKGTRIFDLQTNSGDITVEGPSEFEDEDI